MPTLSDAYRARLESLESQDRESQQQTQETIQRIRSLITDLKAIDLDD
jgi:signal transduction histidine kinase